MTKKKKTKVQKRGIHHHFVLAALIVIPVIVFVTLFNAVTKQNAATNCNFTTNGTTMTISQDCTTDTTISVPDGFTLDGNGHVIAAVDPAGNHFRGAVVLNGGQTAHVKNLTVTVSALADICDAGGDRLRGIMFEGASGSITGTTVVGLNQGASGCQEGNAIEVRNAPFDGTHPAIKIVEVAHNTVSDYQKTGILANGDVDVDIHHNKVGASATQANLAANSVQIGFGARGSVMHNQIAGNSWHTPSAAATAVLLFESGSGVIVSQNTFNGNADTGIYAQTNSATIENNKVFEDGPDGSYDIGIGDYDLYTATPANDNVITNNKVKGYTTAYDEVVGGKNKTISKPNN